MLLEKTKRPCLREKVEGVGGGRVGNPRRKDNGLGSRRYFWKERVEIVPLATGSMAPGW